MENKLSTPNSLNQLPTLQELRIRTSDIKESVLIAMQRVNNELPDIDATVSDVESEFGTVGTEHIQKAIRNGSLGDYGRTFRMSTQEVCIWIRDYCHDKGIVYGRSNQY